MKKRMFLGLGLLVAIVVAAQQIQKPSAPAPPPTRFIEVPPPPPPPPPPVPVNEKAPPPPAAPDAPAPPDVVKEVDLPDDYKAFMKRNPDVTRLGWMHQSRVSITLNTGEREIYRLDDQSDMKRLDSKYGKLPIAPPPPPPMPGKSYQ